MLWLRAVLSPDEIGGALLWQTGADESKAIHYNSNGTLPWSVAHLRGRRDGAVWRISWVRRGADVAVNWAFPEAENVGRFAIEQDMGAGFEGVQDVYLPETAVPIGAVAVRVAEIGADMRRGPWVSIPLNAP